MRWCESVFVQSLEFNYWWEWECINWIIVCVWCYQSLNSSSLNCFIMGYFYKYKSNLLVGSLRLFLGRRRSEVFWLWVRPAGIWIVACFLADVARGSGLGKRALRLRIWLRAIHGEVSLTVALEARRVCCSSGEGVIGVGVNSRSPVRGARGVTVGRGVLSFVCSWARPGIFVEGHNFLRG